ncbi:MAG: hypothetical protein V4450_17450 [Bacteroidota bacterium]
MNKPNSIEARVLSKKDAIAALLERNPAGLANLRSENWNNFDNYDMRDDPDTEWNNWVDWDQDPNPFSNSDSDDE